MSDTAVAAGAPVATRLRRAPRDLARGAALGLLSLGEAALAVGTLLSLVLWFGLGMFPLFLLITVLIRRIANTARELAGRWSGVPVAVPYRPRPRLERTEHGWYWSGKDYHKRRWFAAVSLRVRWIWGDPATWRDLAWLLADPVVGGALAAFPVLLVLTGLTGVLLAVGQAAGVVGELSWLGGTEVPLQIAVGLACVAAGAAFAGPLLRLHGEWTSLLLKPGRRGKLNDRVRQLTRTRADALATQAAELRRIERDLHDGAQARLVAMRMKLAALSQFIDRDPDRAKELVLELRDSSSKALQELRDLVHGIHPPVLAERGLRDALRAFVLDLPLDANVDIELPGRFEPAVEAAVYFSVCEALANVVKHAQTRDVTVRLRFDDGLLAGAVVDEGRGGADLAAGSGLRGIAQRLEAFDGSLGVVSRPGGPTRVSLEIPCALCSPKTSLS
ncbi:sensor histidine kinase [Amycolatopsis sp. NBC_01307]|uniref:sensor histidine kinase n=1 Tax=Amycolatopsis sp. NBC_01307 TaxID=2903561 RepID=UPI002E0F89B1|nr:sensor histidine kinase [Amycolatopsis sp. NBC_01307]